MQTTIGDLIGYRPQEHPNFRPHNLTQINRRRPERPAYQRLGWTPNSRSQARTWLGFVHADIQMKEHLITNPGQDRGADWREDQRAEIEHLEQRARELAGYLHGETPTAR